MKIAVVGINFTKINDDPYNYLIGNRVRTWALFDLLNDFGYETFIYIDKDVSISDEIGAKYRDRFIRDSDKFIALANSGYFDYILFASTKLELLLDHKPWLNKLNKKNIIGVFCYFNTSLSRNFKLLKITRKMVAVGFITPIQKLIWD